MKRRLATAGLIAMLAAAQVWAAESEAIRLAKERGVKQCLPMLTEITRHVLADRLHEVSCMTSNEAPDASLVACDFDVKWKEGANEFVSMTLTPGRKKGSCEAAYMRVTSFAEPCKEARSKYFSKFDQRDRGEATGTITLKAGNAHSIYLVSLASGCQVISREVMAR